MRGHDDYLDPDKHLWPVELPDWWDEMEENCRQILKHFGALHWGEVYRRIYKDTPCGPTLGVLCAGADSAAYNHELTKYLADSPVVQLHVSSIVEGSQAETPTITVDLTTPKALDRLLKAILETDLQVETILAEERAQLKTARKHKRRRKL